ncbi:hypothetical protein OAV81_02675 [Candidatus Thioglobus sp.]|jgi:hypothetical protein|nr:hypothetical protein [Candidatus Thioglobus sp.]
MNKIINFLLNKNLILVLISILGLLVFVGSLMIRLNGYSGLIGAFQIALMLLFFFFMSVLIFLDKEEAKSLWIIVGIGFLVGFWGIL